VTSSSEFISAARPITESIGRNKQTKKTKQNNNKKKQQKNG